MILIVIGAVSILQYIAYLMAYKLNIRYASIVILFSVLALHLYFLPKLFYPKLDPGGVKCGMPILGITLAFWIFGSLAASLAHIFGRLVIKKKMQKS
jgi:hypothetical protein